MDWKTAEKFIEKYEVKKGNVVQWADAHFQDGFDLKSINPDGTERLIEVKSARNHTGRNWSWFELTKLETEVQKKLSEKYWVYLVRMDEAENQIYIKEISPDELKNREKLIEYKRFSGFSDINEEKFSL
jgi:hypothetical protein